MMWRAAEIAVEIAMWVCFVVIVLGSALAVGLWLRETVHDGRDEGWLPVARRRWRP